MRTIKDDWVEYDEDDLCQVVILGDSNVVYSLCVIIEHGSVSEYATSPYIHFIDTISNRVHFYSGLPYHISMPTKTVETHDDETEENS